MAVTFAPLGTARAHVDPQVDLRAPHATPFALLFGTRGLRSANLAVFPKWTRALNRYASEAPRASSACLPVRPNRCLGGEDWQRFLASLAGKDKRVQLEEVSRYVNEAPYLPDSVNYGSEDYWATPFELFARGGDCEDYAIAKFVALRSLGFSNQDLRVVVVQDLSRGRPHAVVVAHLDDQDLVLDNTLSRVVPAGQLPQYRPFYSINEEHWWLHLA